LAEYFGRPHDERAERVRPSNLKLHTSDELWRMRLDAAEDYLAARERNGYSRLPPLSWPTNIPNLRPDAPNAATAVRIIRARRTARGSGRALIVQPARPLRIPCHTCCPAPTKCPALPRARAPPTHAGHQQAQRRLADPPTVPNPSRLPPTPYRPRRGPERPSMQN
jgi:hypothetical protein